MALDGLFKSNFHRRIWQNKDKLIEGLETWKGCNYFICWSCWRCFSLRKKTIHQVVSEKGINNVTFKWCKTTLYNTLCQILYLPSSYYWRCKSLKMLKNKLQLFEMDKSYYLRVEYTNLKVVSRTKINFVDMPNAVQSEISLINRI
jgi:hypothetical protein